LKIPKELSEDTTGVIRRYQKELSEDIKGVIRRYQRGYQKP
jgi:hypothetical protein